VSEDDKKLEAGQSYVFMPPEFRIEEIEGQSRPMNVGFRIMSDDEGIYDITPRAFETDEADHYRGSCGEGFQRPDRQVFPVLPMLEFLWGKPWDNLALNVVAALRPTSLRVVGHNDEITLNSVMNRVTVWLEDDNRTIKEIDMEAVCGGIGVNTGHDLMQKLRTRQVPTDPGKGPHCYINPKGVVTLDLSDEVTLPGRKKP
jgi:hypothetical protein